MEWQRGRHLHGSNIRTKLFTTLCEFECPASHTLSGSWRIESERDSTICHASHVSRFLNYRCLFGCFQWGGKAKGRQAMVRAGQRSCRWIAVNHADTLRLPVTARTHGVYVG